MATFYIFGERAINGTGSFADPFNAPPTITSNNEYLFAAGIEYHNASGTAINVSVNVTGVTIGAYDPATGERIPLGGPKAIIRSGSQYVVRFNTGAHGGIVENLDISTTAQNSNSNGVLVGNTTSQVANNVTIRNCDIHDIIGPDATDGIRYNGTGFVALGNRIWSTSRRGIFCQGPSSFIAHNDIYDIAVSGVGDCIQIIGNATLGCSNTTVMWNKLRNTVPDKQCLIIQDTTGGSAGGLVLGNDMLQNAGPANQALYLECHGIVVQRNTITGGFYNIFVAGNNIVLMANKLIGAAQNGVGFRSTNTGLVARNNSVFSAGNIGINLGTTDATSEARNNLIVGCGTALQRHASSTASHNALWQNVSNGSPGSNTVTTDPLITADGRPLPGSPLLPGSGADLGLVRDLDGRLGRKFIGAYCPATLRVRP